MKSTIIKKIILIVLFFTLIILMLPEQKRNSPALRKLGHKNGLEIILNTGIESHELLQRGKKVLDFNFLPRINYKFIKFNLFIIILKLICIRKDKYTIDFRKKLECIVMVYFNGSKYKDISLA